MSKNRSSIAIVGMQWGGEGKEKIVHLLSERATHIAALTLPATSLPHAHYYIGGGAHLDPKTINTFHVKRLYISYYARIRLEDRVVRLKDLLREGGEVAERLKPFAAPVEELLSDAIKKGERILFEGTGGALLDETFGIEPSVAATAGGICAGMGVGPTRIDHTLGVVKAYGAREGEWLNGALLQQATHLNGADSLALTHLDLLDDFDEIKIATGFKHNKIISAADLGSAVPYYESHPGWKKSTRDIKVYDDLPAEAKAYMRRIEELTGISVSLISVGEKREQTLWLDRFFDE